MLNGVWLWSCVANQPRSGRYLAYISFEVLDAARHVYEEQGFKLEEEEEHRNFGKDLVRQNRELAF